MLLALLLLVERSIKEEHFLHRVAELHTRFVDESVRAFAFVEALSKTFECVQSVVAYRFFSAKNFDRDRIRGGSKRVKAGIVPLNFAGLIFNEYKDVFLLAVGDDEW
jgi:hypothetical protein